MTSRVPRHRVFEFASLRADWYCANQALPRAIRQTVERRRSYTFEGFPRQWLPLFAWFGVRWRNTVAPQEYLPFFSDIEEGEFCRIIRRATAEGMLRPMLEAAATLDPTVSDAVYILDHTVSRPSRPMREELASKSSRKPKALLLSSWLAYSRPSVLEMEKKILNTPSRGDAAVLLPCSYKRPYGKSPTHRRVYALLKQQGYALEAHDKIVITSLGVIPEECWEFAAVLQYDAGVPDLYRLLRLLREFFARRPYRYIVDCLDFAPYSDLLRIVQREGLIKDLRRMEMNRRSAFFVRLRADDSAR
jgi:hypothetical protein